MKNYEQARLKMAYLANDGEDIWKRIQTELVHRGFVADEALQHLRISELMDIGGIDAESAIQVWLALRPRPEDIIQNLPEELRIVHGCLASIYFSRQSAVSLIGGQLNLDKVDLSGSAYAFWLAIIQHASNDELVKIIRCAQRDNDMHSGLRLAEQAIILAPKRATLSPIEHLLGAVIQHNERVLALNAVGAEVSMDSVKRLSEDAPGEMSTEWLQSEVGLPVGLARVTYAHFIGEPCAEHFSREMHDVHEALVKIVNNPAHIRAFFWDLGLKRDDWNKNTSAYRAWAELISMVGSQGIQALLGIVRREYPENKQLEKLAERLLDKG